MARKNAAKPHNDSQALDAHARRQTALALRRRTFTYRRIASEMGISEASAYTYVKDAYAELNRVQNESAEALREQELDKLDELEQRLSDLLPDAEADAVTKLTGQLLRIAERRAKLLGLDAPTRTQVTGDDGGPLTIRIVHDD